MNKRQKKKEFKKKHGFNPPKLIVFKNTVQAIYAFNKKINNFEKILNKFENISI